MHTLGRLFLLAGVLGGVPTLTGCGDSGSDKPVVIVPAVPPTEAANDSIQSYLKNHPNAAKKAGKGVVK